MGVYCKYNMLRGTIAVGVYCKYNVEGGDCSDVEQWRCTVMLRGVITVGVYCKY